MFVFLFTPNSPAISVPFPLEVLAQFVRSVPVCWGEQLKIPACGSCTVTDLFLKIDCRTHIFTWKVSKWFVFSRRPAAICKYRRMAIIICIWPGPPPLQKSNTFPAQTWKPWIKTHVPLWFIRRHNFWPAQSSRSCPCHTHGRPPPVWGTFLQSH